MMLFSSGKANDSGNNKGYTLVELVVVIAIMTIMIGLLSVGVSILFSKDGERVARIIDENLSDVRTSTMTKPGTFSITIHTTASGTGNYIEIEKTELELATPTPEAPGAVTPPPASPSTTQIDIKEDAYITFGPQGSVPVTATDNKIIISFDKANGSVTQISTETETYSGATLDDVFEIKCVGVRNTTRSASILLMPVTGRHYIEKQ